MIMWKGRGEEMRMHIACRKIQVSKRDSGSMFSPCGDSIWSKFKVNKFIFSPFKIYV